jgi:drug/metabolite transporter (DMT)-like permease
VSVVTPVMGSKTVFVALCSTLLLGAGLPLAMWLSAGMSFLAILCLNLRPGAVRNQHREKSGLGVTLLMALSAAACYALFDVLVQMWSPAWGFGRFLPIMCGFAWLGSCVFIPLFKQPLRAVPRVAWPWLLGGGLFVALQSLSLITALAVFGDATPMNVVYSGRGLWSVVLVWVVGHWFGNTELSGGSRAVLGWRLLGAVLMMSAIIIAVLR